MSAELILCIPGNWTDRADLLRRIITLDPAGRYMFAGGILADIQAKDHVPLEFCPADPNLTQAFRYGGQGKIPPEILADAAAHTSIAYLHFPPDLPGQCERILAFTEVMRQAGGIAMKVESSGVGHTWERWTALLAGTPFDQYCSAVVLIGGEDHYYSCGMHLFGLPECEVPRTLSTEEGAELINQFNIFQIVDQPQLASGHTFSVAADAPRYRLSRELEQRYAAGDLFHNPHGIWRLSPA